MIQTLANEWKEAGVQEGDVVLVHSSIKSTFRRYLKLGTKLTAQDILESFLNAVGSSGTLLFPLFNFDFSNGVPFDIRNTPSHMGALTEAARMYPLAVRTGHPIYSFAVIGAHAEKFEKIDNFSGYGSDSPFAVLREMDGKIAVLDLPDQNSMTFYHHVEEMYEVDYRYHKEFTANYTGASGKTKSKKYGLFVRNIEKGVLTHVNPAGELMWQRGLFCGCKPNEGSGLRTISARKMYEFVADIIESGKAKNILYRIGGKKMPNLGLQMHELCQELFPICRSITGDGFRQSLAIISEHLPNLKTVEVPTGTKCFDWEVPKEWNIQDAYIIAPNGRKICDFKQSNLHVVGYSTPVDKKITLDELQKHLYSLPDQPNAIPYVTSYYNERWGFCLTHAERVKLEPGEYHIYIDSELKNGALTYGELVMPGESDKEIFLSSYLCHPSMANNELSGPVVTTFLAKWISEQKRRRYTYRIIIIPETIGSITYLSRNHKELKSKVIAGFNVTCIGDERAYSYLPSREGNTLSDKVAQHVLKYLHPNFITYSFLDRGSDERQYCSPGIDLPVCSVMRTKYGCYPEYHTSLDDLNLVTPKGLLGGYEVLRKIIECLEFDEVLFSTVPCEPQLGKRGLYPTISTKSSGSEVRTMMNYLAYCDGKLSSLEIAEIIGTPLWELKEIIQNLKKEEVIEIAELANKGI
jgi:aminopeptidase-like protein/aminoglycoside N3'-acetyltransferase